MRLRVTPPPPYVASNRIIELGRFSRQSLDALGVIGKVLILHCLELIPTAFSWMPSFAGQRLGWARWIPAIMLVNFFAY